MSEGTVVEGITHFATFSSENVANRRIRSKKCAGTPNNRWKKCGETAKSRLKNAAITHKSHSFSSLRQRLNNSFIQPSHDALWQVIILCFWRITAYALVRRQREYEDECIFVETDYMFLSST